MALSEIFLLGLNHKTAPVEVREKIAFLEEEIPPFLAELKKCGVYGSVLVSTCNRVEIYIDIPKEINPQDLLTFLLKKKEINENMLSHFYLKSGREVVSHLFKVASGLDSMILGEPQIFGQIKDAYFLAKDNGFLSTPLNLIFQRAMYVAKKVRTESGIGTQPVTVSYAAFSLAKTIFSDVSSKKTLLIGAGEMIRIVASHFYDEGSKNIYVTNRTYERAVEFSKIFNANVVKWEDFPKELIKVDIVITSTASPYPIITKALLETIMKIRKWKPLLIIDIAVPRDVEEKAKEIDGLYLYDIDDLQKCADSGLEERKRRAKIAESMIEEEVSLYGHFLEHRELPKLIESLIEEAHKIGENEISNHLTKLKDKNDEELLRKTVFRVIHKLLHPPITQLKRIVLEEERDEAIEIFERFFNISSKGKEKKID